MTKIIVNPKTGRMETVKDEPAATPESVRKAREELREKLNPSKGWHVDELDKKPEPAGDATWPFPRSI